MKRIIAAIFAVLISFSWAHAAYTPAPGAPMPYLGQVATRAAIPDQHFSGDNEQQTRSKHFARVNITSLQIAAANWWVTGGSPEQGQITPTSITASVEYPVGTITRILFNGQVTGSILNLTSLVSDPVAVVIPEGAAFYIRMHEANANGIVFNQINLGYSGTGDGWAAGVTTPDLTGGGDVAAATSFDAFPVAIIAQTVKTAVCLVGDSRVVGFQDTEDATGDVGEFARGVGPSYGYISIASTGDSAEAAAASFTNRLALVAYCSHVLLEYGINDIVAGASAAATAAANNTLIADFASIGLQRVWIATLPTETTSSDWSTYAGQTIIAHNDVRVTYNTGIRNGGLIIGAQGYMDFDTYTAGSMVSTDAGFNKWRIGPYPCTLDGIHEVIACTTGEAAANVVGAQNLTR